MELPHGATDDGDLSGDTGAIGRFSASASADKATDMRLDLKGVLYSASLLPLVGTACIVAIGATEAKVSFLS